MRDGGVELFDFRASDLGRRVVTGTRQFCESRFWWGAMGKESPDTRRLGGWRIGFPAAADKKDEKC